MTLTPANATTMDDLVLVDDLVDVDDDATFTDSVTFDDDLVEEAKVGVLKGGQDKLTKKTIVTPYVFVVPILIVGAIASFVLRKFLKREKQHWNIEIEVAETTVDSHKSDHWDDEMQEPMDCESGNRDVVNAHKSDHWDDEKQEPMDCVRGNRDEVNQHTSVEERTIPSSTCHYVLSEAEAWSRAKYFFPNLIPGNEVPLSVLRRYELPEDRLETLLHKRVDELKKSGTFETLSEPGKETDLCVALGMEETYVRKRYEVVDRLREAFGLESKTTTIDTILHLIYCVQYKGPLVDNAKFLNGQKWPHDDYPWVNYRGYVVKKGNIAQLLSRVKKNLSADKDDDLYVHGTNGSNLIKMAKHDGQMHLSQNTPFYRHDFGSGFYCFKDWSKALSFAIDRCWPERDEQGKFESNNPCLLMFPDCKLKDDDFYNVIGCQPNTVILKFEQKGEYKEFQRSLKDDKDKRDTKWKEFVKMAMHFDKRPHHWKGYRGYLHDCNPTSIANTTFFLNSIPKIDKDRWIQYCFRGFDNNFGRNQIYVEFDVDWNEWVNNDPTDMPPEEADDAFVEARDSLGTWMGEKKEK